MSNPAGRDRLAHGRYIAVGPTLGTGNEYPLRLTVDGVLMVDASGGGGVIVVQAEGQYNATLPTIADGDLEPLQLDVRGRLITAVQYNATPPTITDTLYTSPQSDVNGNLKVVEQYAPQAEDNTNDVYAVIERPLVGATYAPTLYNFSFASSGTTGIVIKATPGNLFSLRATKSPLFATTSYLQFFNRTTVPPGGTACLFQVALNPSPLDGSQGPPVILDHSVFTQAGLAFTSGITWGLSSTSNTFTGVGEDMELLATYL